MSLQNYFKRFRNYIILIGDTNHFQFENYVKNV